ncbi:Signal transduction histidine kinase [Chryseobacterium wanjuense]|uniref:histidine kinase n=1 Tax=Chryseobacterium wanjuense TaxID=356305 RepID=A0A1I0S416_9FLAO|nr:HAMP domain-containing sensor histidine kinase [Chryseobacterium wanjuense]SEW49344.1 Signal transduction histidine kinase [Chryseobacterium wanjuense]
MKLPCLISLVLFFCIDAKNYTSTRYATNNGDIPSTIKRVSHKDLSKKPTDIENIYLQKKLERKFNSQNISINDKKHTLTVSPGRYDLVVKFLISEKGKYIYKTIPIEIRPYFYQTFTFKITFLLVGIIFILMAIRFRSIFLRKNRVLTKSLHDKNIQLLETNTTLEITQNRLKTESDYQKKLIESISHDITTPVKFIAMLSQELAESDDTKTQKKYFDSIHKTSEQLYKFTLSLKEYTELYKEENTSKQEYKIYDLIEEKRLLFEQIALKKNTMMYNFCDHHISTKINRNILSSVFHNIIDNAVKHTSDGEITIRTKIIDSYVELDITDTGSGMSDEQIQYYTLLSEDSTCGNLIFKNYGLGLHIVIQLIKKTNSKIYFQKNKTKGTTIKILITYE